MPTTSVSNRNWAADVAISMPLPPSQRIPIVHVLDGTGFGLTTFGIQIVITDADKEEIFSGFFSPVGSPNKVSANGG